MVTHLHVIHYDIYDMVYDTEWKISNIWLTYDISQMIHDSLYMICATWCYIGILITVNCTLLVPRKKSSFCLFTVETLSPKVSYFGRFPSWIEYLDDLQLNSSLLFVRKRTNLFLFWTFVLIKGKVEHPTNDMRSMDQWNRFLPRFLLLLQLVLAKDKETLLSSFWSTLQSQHFNSIHFTSDCFHFYCCENLFHPTRSRFVPLAPGEGNQAPERVCCCSFHRACAWRGDAVYIFFCSVVADWNVFTEQRDSRQLCVWVVKHWEEHDESILVA